MDKNEEPKGIEFGIDKSTMKVPLEGEEQRIKEKALLICTEALRAAEMRQGCTNHSYHAEILLRQVKDALFPQGDMAKCEHKITSKLIEIPGEDGHMFGTEDYIMDYKKLTQIAHKMATGEGEEYCYLEYLVCTECDTILEKNEIFT